MNILKVMIGVTPKRSSKLFFWKVMEDQLPIVKIFGEVWSCLLQKLFGENDAIMADGGIEVQDLMVPQNVQVNTPTLMGGANQLPTKTIIKD
jgi:hypothetical protein